MCIAIVVLMLTACESLTKHSPATAPVPASLLQPCPPLTPLEGMTGEIMLKKIIEVSHLYYDCADGKEKLIDAVKH